MINDNNSDLAELSYFANNNYNIINISEKEENILTCFLYKKIIDKQFPIILYVLWVE